MNHYKYVIIGMGIAADAAVSAIRRLDREGSLAVIGDEPHPPYDRPPLSKELWKGKPLEIIWRSTKARAEELILGRTVISIDPQKKEVCDDQGEIYGYEALLLAIGGKTRKLPFGGENILYFRTLEDYQNLLEMSEKGDHFGVIGGGFIGSEIAAALNMNGKKVSMLFPEEGIGARVFPSQLSQFLNEYFREKGVHVLAGTMVTDVKKANGTYLIETDRPEPILVDGVIAGVGILPGVELAQLAGIKTGNGIIVDEMMRTNYPDIYAAGDGAEFPQHVLGKRVRLEHEDNAKMMGKQAGRNMTGLNEPYNHLSYFYSDLFELGYVAVGEIDSRLETYMDWEEPFKKGVVYYLDNGRVQGVLLWNFRNAVAEARALITEPGPFKESDLKNKLSL